MYTIQYVLICWLSFASAKKELGETCPDNFECASQHCIPECESDGSVSRCVEPKSFYEHLGIAYPECIDRHISEMLMQKVPTATSGIGQKCTHHGDCVTGNCAPVCDVAYITSYPRCIEPVFSFSRYNKPIPTCISRKAIADHLKLFRTNGEIVDLQETGTRRPTRTPIGRPMRTQHYLQETGTSTPTRTPIGRPMRSRPILKDNLQETGTNSWHTKAPIGRPKRSRPAPKDYLQDLQINWSTNERSN